MISLKTEMYFKTIIKDWLPPAMYKWFNGQAYRLRSDDSSCEDLSGFTGNYATWEEASASCTGYDDSAILAKVLDATLKVKRGEAVYERDSVLFDKIQYSWPLLAGLLRSASENNNKLSVLDFGGSLGSSYFQNKNFLECLNSDLRWSVVEQKHFVECGKEYFQDEQLKFYNTIDEVLIYEHPNVILISSVLQYLSKPYDFIESVVSKSIPYLILDRTAFLLDKNGKYVNADKITIQNVPASIYDADIPLWFLNYIKILDIIENDYDCIADFDALSGTMSALSGSVTVIDKGFVFKYRR